MSALAAECIADLDAGLAENGEDIVLIRGSRQVTCRARVTGYDPAELVGDITQQDSRVILSPTEIAADGWPGANNGPATPQKNDRAKVQGFNKVVQAGTAIQVGGRTVRIELRVRGQAS